MKAGLICLLTLVNLMSSCINRDKSFDGESFLVGTGRYWCMYCNSF